LAPASRRKILNRDSTFSKKRNPLELHELGTKKRNKTTFIAGGFNEK
jgi:hypothetical protein